MRAGEGDVATHRSSDDRHDGQHVDRLRRNRRAHRLHVRRARRDRHIQGQPDHQKAQRLREAVHGSSRLRDDEQGDRDCRAHCRADADVQIHQRLQAESCATDVADIEREPTRRHEQRKQPAQSRSHVVGDVLRPTTGDGENAPDVELRDEVDDDTDQDREREAGAKPLGKDGRLGEKTRADRGRGHEERRADEGRPQCFTVHGANDTLGTPTSSRPPNDAVHVMNSPVSNRHLTPSVFTPLDAGDVSVEPPTGPSEALREALLRDQAELEREVILWQRWVRYIAAALAGAAILLTSGAEDLPALPLTIVAACYVLCVAATGWIVQRTPASRPRSWLPALLVTADLVAMGAIFYLTNIQLVSNRFLILAMLSVPLAAFYFGWRL